MSTGGGGDHQSPPLPGGDFLLQLLQRPPPRQPSVASVGPAVLSSQIQSNGRDLSHPPFAPHAYIHGYPANPNPTVTISDKFEKLGLFDRNYSASDRDMNSVRNGLSGNTSEGNPQFNRYTDNFYSSPNTSRNPRNPNNGYGADLRNNQNQNGEGSNMVMNGYRTNHRSPPISSSEGSNRALNGYEPNYRNSPIPNRIPEGYDRYNRALNGFEAGYRNPPNSSRMGEGFDRPNRALNGFEANHRNSPHSSRIGEGYDRPARVDSNGTGEGGYNRAMNGSNSGFSNNPNSGGTVGRTGKAVRQPPPGFSKKANNINAGNNVDKGESSSNGGREKGVMREDRRNSGGVIDDKSVSTRLDPQAPPTGSAVHLGSGCEDLESLSEELRSNIGEDGENLTKFEGDLDEQTLGSTEQEDLSSNKNKKNKRDKEYRQDTRGGMVIPQGMRKSRSMIPCRSDIDILNAPLLSIYDSLVPPEEEKLRQKQLLTVLEKLVINEWPGARLLVYGSCANSFGVKNSDIDICLAMRDPNVNKSEILLKLADILEAENFENVQALTHARVPIVKLMDPATGISCDICINNVLAVVNSKLLRDYAKIDDRLRQLAFIVKHWAKSRGVNATYHGTLSSYAYVLMCIHFLQQCRPPILPCLQGMMDVTYNVVIDNVQCAFFDQVEKLSGFGLRNRESIGQLLWGFFRYWAYCHDYAHDVVSVRVGSLISKRAKDWTRRVGNDRHLICIEDPFETTHDLGRVVDKFSIKVLREEFERAAEILQYDPNPCVTLFEPYVPS